MTCVRLDFTYRDASNYKMAGSVRFAGEFDFDDVMRLEKSLDPMTGFVPSAVGIEHLQFPGSAGRTDDDHPYHEVHSVSSDPGEPDDERTFKQFVDECEKVNWDEAGERWSRDTPICDAPYDEAD
jgi:hypothetical protein